MARKTNAVVNTVKQAREDLEGMLEVEDEIATDLRSGFTDQTLIAMHALTNVLAKAHNKILRIPTDDGWVELPLSTREVSAASSVVATHILVALGLADFQVGGFEMPEHACVFCGASV